MADSILETMDLLLLMGGGGLLSVLGFWLMLREGPGGGGAEIALGSLHVPASTAGFAIFFSGLATFSAPIVAPETTHQAMVRIAPASLRPGTGDPATFVQAGGHFGADDEPANDSFEGATVLDDGQLLGGTQTGKDVDWYQVEVDPRIGGRIEVDMAGAGRGCRASLFNGSKAYLGLEPLARGRNELKLDPASGERIYVKLDCRESDAVNSYTIAYASEGR